jgi:CxxC motif-containing protein (DUF1111 family)
MPCRTSGSTVSPAVTVEGIVMNARWTGVFFVAACVGLVASTSLAQRSDSSSTQTARQKAKPSQQASQADSGSQVPFGAALDGLNSTELAMFNAGREEFEAVETPEHGLGPIFNNNSCVSCHSMQASGGASAITETRRGKFANGKFDPLDALGGTLLHQFAIDPAMQETIPKAANVVAQRITTPLFGIGLIEAIADEDIQLNAQKPKPDGVQGRAARIVDVVSGETHVGRFGWKAQHSSVLGFAADAYLNEMGITSRFFPEDRAPNGKKELLAAYDKVPDPEDVVNPDTGKSDIDASAEFVRFLAPPPTLRMSASALAGGSLFQSMNCATCHTPVMFTAANRVAALSNQPVRLFSDLLLHDMGVLGDGIEQADAGRRDMRTPPLWGLRGRGPFLHDGRAQTVDQAIRGHDGEAKPARDRYRVLSPEDQQSVLDFLAAI